MSSIYQFVDDAIEAKRGEFTAIADDIWDHPETRFEEHWSAERLACALEAEGFSVTRGSSQATPPFAAATSQRWYPEN